MKDYLVRGMSMDGLVKVVAIRSTQMVRRGAEIHKTTPNATAAFGRALTAASMMGNMQKVDNGSMTLQIKGDGPIGGMSVVMCWNPMCRWLKSSRVSWMWEVLSAIMAL